MNCIGCGLDVGNVVKCPHCGYDNSVQHKAMKISNLYYNQGLDRALIRDMSGAIDMLERSLKFNKRNIDARNLLGLVYFETGEVVSALSEWVISKNMKPERNVAAEYIDKVQANQPRLENIQRTIRRYNRALDLCRAGDEDVAIVTLKKVIEANPKLIKAYYLLALIYLKKEEYEKARKALRKALPIDRTNPTAMRFLMEIDEQTGTVADTDELRQGIVRSGKKGMFGFRRKEAERQVNRGYTTINWDDEENIITEPVVQPIAFHQLPAFGNILNMIIGIVLGAFIIGLIVVPAVKRGISRQADEQVEQYSQTLVTQNAYISTLESELEEITAQITSGNEEITNAQSSISALESLLDAVAEYAGGELDDAREMLLAIDTSLLSEASLETYNAVLDDINTTQFNSYYETGYSAFQLSNFGDAAAAFTNALNYDPDNYAAMAYLAHAYRLTGDADGAISAFQSLAETFPNTTVAANAQRYVAQLSAGNFTIETGINEVNSEIVAGLVETQNAADAEEEEEQDEETAAEG